jgi:SNF2 family DNA or RNA helicase
VEKNGDKGQLDKLRRRVRPLMMRRTKDQVIKDLPPKQEQILEVVLNPRHQKVYQTHLQRERQKILGLIEDVNKNRFTIFQSLTLLRQLSLDASLVDPALTSVRSSKLDVLFEQLEDLVAEGHRALIFSQFTGFLGRSGSGWTRRRSSTATSTAAPATVPTSSVSSRTAARRCS